MTYSQQDYEAGKYAPESLYGRLGECMREKATTLDLLEADALEIVIAYIKEIIAQVEGRIKCLTTTKDDVSEFDVYRCKERLDERIDELTRLLVGQPFLGEASFGKEGSKPEAKHEPSRTDLASENDEMEK